MTARQDRVQPTETSSRDLLIAIGIALVPLALYWPVRKHAFVSYDDIVYIVENSHLRAPLDWARVCQVFATAYESNWIPLTWLSLHLDFIWYGLDPAGHHLTNAGLHAASAGVLFLAFTRLTGARGRSAFVALVFAVHPLHVESVAWATERKDTLSGLFWMLSLWAYAAYVHTPAGTAKRLRYTALVVCFGLGLLAKPIVVTLPFALLLLDYWPSQRLRRDGGLGWPQLGPSVRAVVEKLPLIALAAAASAVTIAVQRDSGAMSHGDLLPLAVRLATALDSFRWYAFASFWPADLAVFYPHPLAIPELWWLGGVMAVVSLGIAIRCAISRPQLLVGLLWFAGTLVPVIGVVQAGMQARADRYMYLPLIGIAMIVAWSWPSSWPSSWPQRSPHGDPSTAQSKPDGTSARWLGPGLGMLAIAALCFVTRAQIAHWRDSTALYERAIAVTQDNFLAENSLALELIETGKLEAAEAHAREAIRIKPRWPDPHVTLGDLVATRGEPQQAVGHYEAALRLTPDHPRAHANLASVLIDVGRGDEAIGHLHRALAMQRNIGFAHLHGLLGQALAQIGELEQSVVEYEKALAARPDWGAAIVNLGFVLIQLERFERADVLLSDARERGLATFEIALLSGQTAAALGRTNEMLDHYRDAVERSPGWHPIANNLAWLLATRPDATAADAEEAVSLARESVAKRGRDPNLLDTLAVALAASGDFEGATQMGLEAAAFAEADANTTLAEDIRARVAGYRAARPHIEQPVTRSR